MIPGPDIRFDPGTTIDPIFIPLITVIILIIIIFIMIIHGTVFEEEEAVISMMIMKIPEPDLSMNQLRRLLLLVLLLIVLGEKGREGIHVTDILLTAVVP